MEKTFGKARGMAQTALWLLLAINLFNYIDRYILAAVLPQIKHDFLAGDPNQHAKAGSLGSAFLISYMCAAPILGWLAGLDASSRPRGDILPVTSPPTTMQGW